MILPFADRWFVTYESADRQYEKRAGSQAIVLRCGAYDQNERPASRKGGGAFGGVHIG
jgi:hypothetical protein